MRRGSIDIWARLLDLEDADGIGPAEHVEDLRIGAGNACQIKILPVVTAKQVEAAVQAGQHAEAEHVDLEDAERVEVVLVPLDDRAIGHGGVLDRHQLEERPAGHDEAADVLGEVAREADQLARQVERLAEPPVGRVEAQLLQGGGHPRPSRLQPQSALAMAAMRSCDRPKTLPTLAHGGAGPR